MLRALGQPADHGKATDQQEHRHQGLGLGAEGARRAVAGQQRGLGVGEVRLGLEVKDRHRQVIGVPAKGRVVEIDHGQAVA